MNRICYTLLLTFFMLNGGMRLYAQTPTDALSMDKNQICNALLYSNSSWSEYWEGDLRRSNENIGTNTTQTVMYMANYGLTKKLNLIAAVPYVWTANSQGHLAGQSAIQDISLWAKYRAIQHDLGSGQATVFATLGVSTPGSKYHADLLPMAVGMGCRSASARLVADYRLGFGAYITAQGGYTARSNSKTDRDAYLLGDHIVYSNKIPVPNIGDFSVNLGFRRGLFNFAVNYAQMVCLSGDNIRRNDAPFPSNKMDATVIGAMAKFHAKHLGFVVNASQVVAGKNMGRATTLQGGILYAFYTK